MAHPGGQDQHGGHLDSSSGQYHFHNGPLAGRSFPTREAALVALGEALPLPPQPNVGNPPDTISLASWNIRNVSSNSRTEAELGIISLILFRYDFIAIQEVRDEEVLARIVGILQNDFQVTYQFDVSNEVGTTTHRERYAFLWRTDRVTRTQAGNFFNDTNNDFVREPYCASFQSGTFDWTICTVHILFGSSPNERRPEIRHLDDLYRSVRSAGTERDIFICGDFNFPPDDVGWDQLRAEDNMKFAIDHPGRTTIADVSLFDNCWWPQAAVEVIEGSANIFEFDEVMYPPGSRDEAFRLTSDHRPISIRIRTNGPDDD